MPCHMADIKQDDFSWLTVGCQVMGCICSQLVELSPVTWPSPVWHNSMLALGGGAHHCAELWQSLPAAL